MASDALLSDLCSICYTDKPKYRCPRCKTQTCSLPCYKKHQQRADCSGKRDPAEYVKKSQLATPVGIDRDYNYLKGIEQSIDHAHRVEADLGIDGSKAFKRASHPDSKLQKYFVTNNITVERAPRGMSRQKINTTRTTKRGHVMWTIEWIDAHGNKEIQDHCLESDTIEVIRGRLENEKRNAEKRKQQAGNSSDGNKKRRRQEPQSEAGQMIKVETPLGDSVSTKPEHAGDTAAKIEETDEPEQTIQTEPPTNDQPAPTADPQEKTNHDPTENPTSQTPTSAPIKPEANIQTAPSPPSKPSFYLHHPLTPTPLKILVPLNPKSTLIQVLQNQTVLEYPTIYMLPSQLPAGFMLEKEYRKMRRGEERVVRTEEKEEGGSGSGSGSGVDGVVDANRILEMLRRDVTRR